MASGAFQFRAACGNPHSPQWRYTSSRIDFLAGYVAPLDRWLIIPVRALRHVRQFIFTLGPRCRARPFLDAWALLERLAARASSVGPGALAGTALDPCRIQSQRVPSPAGRGLTRLRPSPLEAPGLSPPKAAANSSRASAPVGASRAWENRGQTGRSHLT